MVPQIPIVLASRSPRRRSILANAGFDFIVRFSNVSEERLAGEAPANYVRRLAREKAEAVVYSEKEIVLGADTVVVLDGAILQKPTSPEDAVSILQLLRDRQHSVLTGIYIQFGENQISEAVETKVRFGPISDDEIAEYVASGEPMDKAGAYGIQGLAARFITSVDGCYFNVVGLPVSVFYRHWKKLYTSRFEAPA